MTSENEHTMKEKNLHGKLETLMILNCCMPLTEQDKQFVEIVEKLFQFPTLKTFCSINYLILLFLQILH